MGKYRKKPVVVEARQFTGTGGDVYDLVHWINHGRYDAGYTGPMAVGLNDDLVIPTPEGEMKANPGDWIIKGVNGEFYPCKPDIFEKTYEAVEA